MNAETTIELAISGLTEAQVAAILEDVIRQVQAAGGEIAIVQEADDAAQA